jgi:hypothetical protein
MCYACIFWDFAEHVLTVYGLQRPAIETAETQPKSGELAFLPIRHPMDDVFGRCPAGIHAERLSAEAPEELTALDLVKAEILPDADADE